MYGVFVDGVIGPHLLPDYVAELKRAQAPVHFVLLLPTVDEIVRRGLSREGVVRVPEGLLRRGHDTFARHGAFAGWTLDNSGMTAEQAADAVMEACGRGDALAWSPA
jgi:hypothetical protein